MRESSTMPGIAFHIAIGLTLAATPTAGGPMPMEKCMATGLIQEAICTVSIPICGANFKGDCNIGSGCNRVFSVMNRTAARHNENIANGPSARRSGRTMIALA